MTTHATYGDHTLAIDDRTGHAHKVLPATPGTHNGAVRREAVTPPSGPRPQPKDQDGDAPKYRSKLEARYAGYIEALKFAGEIRTIRYEAVRLEIAPNTTILPDFYVERPDRSCELHEVKGFMREDAWIKLKVAARQWPHYRWFLITRVKGQWVTKRIPSS